MKCLPLQVEVFRFDTRDYTFKEFTVSQLTAVLQQNSLLEISRHVRSEYINILYPGTFLRCYQDKLGFHINIEWSHSE